MGKKRKPYDPAAQARLEAEKREREAEIARLIAQGATVKHDAAKRVISAKRSNVFNILHQRGTITQNQHDAAYRLATDWAIWKGLDGKGDRGEAVDCSSGSTELVTDRMIQAGKRVRDTMQLVAIQHETLLTDLMIATVEEDRPMLWRGIVERSIGVTVRDRQTAAVVDALDALRAVYEQPRRVAA